MMISTECATDGSCIAVRLQTKAYVSPGYREIQSYSVMSMPSHAGFIGLADNHDYRTTTMQVLCGHMTVQCVHHTRRRGTIMGCDL